MREIKLNLSTSDVNNVGQIVVRQDDDNTQKIIATITENGKPKNLAGYTIFFNAMINDTVIARDLAKMEGNTSTVSYTLISPFFQKVGRMTGYFSFEKGNVRESSADFYYHVIKGSCRNIRQGSYIYDLEEILSKSDDIIKNGNFLPLLKSIREVDAKTEGYHLDALTKIDKFEQDVNKTVSKHIDDKQNPHAVTAKQTGAYTTKEADKLISSEANKKVIRRKEIFKGARYFNAEAKYNYNLEDNQVLAKVKLTFSRFGNDDPEEADNYGWYSFEFDGSDFGEGSHYRALIDTAGNIGVQRFYVRSTGVSGHDHNWDDKAARRWKLRMIHAYYYNI